MTKDEIIQMVLSVVPELDKDEAQGGGDTMWLTYQELQRFAALVAAKAAEKEREPLTNEQIREVLYKHQKSSYEACGIDTEGMKLMDDSLFTELLGYVKAVLAAHGIK